MDSPFLGMVQYFAFDWAPKGYALANGALLSIQQNTALFALFGTYYGGNGSNTFGMPDLRGRSVVGQSNSLTMGEKFGTPSVTLLTTNMPQHTHSAPAMAMGAWNDARAFGSATDPTGNFSSILSGANQYTATPDAGVSLGAPTVTVGITGQSLPFNTQNPYLAITATISTVGIFPSRN
jgi:microcystin-dependent protein